MVNLFRCGSGGSSGGAKIYYLGEKTPSSSTTVSFNISEILPDVDYKKLTEDNFIVGINKVGGGYSNYYYHSSGSYYYKGYYEGSILDKEYNPVTGILTFTSGSKGDVDIHRSSSYSGTYKSPNSIYTISTKFNTVFAYLVLGDIEDVSIT